MAKQAFFVVAKIHHAITNSTYWHPMFECESNEEAKETAVALPKMHDEVERQIIVGKPSGDCREYRPC